MRPSLARLDEAKIHASLAFHELTEGEEGRRRALLEEIALKHFIQHADAEQHLDFDHVDACLASLLGPLSYRDTVDVLSLCNNDQGHVGWFGFRRFLFSDQSRFKRLLADEGLTRRFLDLKVAIGVGSPPTRTTFLEAAGGAPPAEEEGDGEGEEEDTDDSSSTATSSEGSEASEASVATGAVPAADRAREDQQHQQAAVSSDDAGQRYEYGGMRPNTPGLQTFNAATEKQMVHTKVGQIHELQNRIRQLQHEVELHKTAEEQNLVAARMAAAAAERRQERTTPGELDAESPWCRRHWRALGRLLLSGARGIRIVHVVGALLAIATVCTVLPLAAESVLTSLTTSMVDVVSHSTSALAGDCADETARTTQLIAAAVLRGGYEMPVMAKSFAPLDAQVDGTVNVTERASSLARLVQAAMVAGAEDHLVSECRIGTPGGVVVGATWHDSHKPGTLSVFVATDALGEGRGCVSRYRLLAERGSLAVRTGTECGGHKFRDSASYTEAIDLLGDVRAENWPPRVVWAFEQYQKPTVAVRGPSQYASRYSLGGQQLMEGYQVASTLFFVNERSVSANSTPFLTATLPSGCGGGGGDPRAGSWGTPWSCGDVQSRVAAVVSCDLDLDVLRRRARRITRHAAKGHQGLFTTVVTLNDTEAIQLLNETAVLDEESRTALDRLRKKRLPRPKNSLVDAPLDTRPITSIVSYLPWSYPAVARFDRLQGVSGSPPAGRPALLSVAIGSNGTSALTLWFVLVGTAAAAFVLIVGRVIPWRYWRDWFERRCFNRTRRRWLFATLCPCCKAALARWRQRNQPKIVPGSLGNTAAKQVKKVAAAATAAEDGTGEGGSSIRVWPKFVWNGSVIVITLIVWFAVVPPVVDTQIEMQSMQLWSAAASRVVSTLRASERAVASSHLGTPPDVLLDRLVLEHWTIFKRPLGVASTLSVWREATSNASAAASATAVPSTTRLGGVSIAAATAAEDGGFPVENNSSTATMVRSDGASYEPLRAVLDDGSVYVYQGRRYFNPPMLVRGLANRQSTESELSGPSLLTRLLRERQSTTRSVPSDRMPSIVPVWSATRRLSSFPGITNCSLVVGVSKTFPPEANTNPFMMGSTAELPRAALWDVLASSAAAAVGPIAAQDANQSGVNESTAANAAASPLKLPALNLDPIVFIFDIATGDVVASSEDVRAAQTAGYYRHPRCKCDACTAPGDMLQPTKQTAATQSSPWIWQAIKALQGNDFEALEPAQSVLRLTHPSVAATGGQPDFVSDERVVTAAPLRVADATGVNASLRLSGELPKTWILVALTSRQAAYKGFVDASARVLVAVVCILAAYYWAALTRAVTLRRRSSMTVARADRQLGGNHPEIFPDQEFNAAMYNILKPGVQEVHQSMQAALAEKPLFHGKDFKTQKRRQKVRDYKAIEWIVLGHRGYHVQDLLVCDLMRTPIRKRVLLLMGSAPYVAATTLVGLLHCCLVFMETPLWGDTASNSLLWSLVCYLRAGFLVLQTADCSLYLYCRGWRDFEEPGEGGKPKWKVHRVTLSRCIVLFALVVDAVVQFMIGYQQRRTGVMMLFPATVLARPLLVVLKSPALRFVCKSVVRLVQAGSDVLMATGVLLTIAALWATLIFPGDTFANAVNSIAFALSPGGHPLLWQAVGGCQGSAATPKAASSSEGAALLGLYGAEDLTAASEHPYCLLTFYHVLLLPLALGVLVFVGATMLATTQDVYGRLCQERAADRKRSARLGTIAAFVLLDEYGRGAIRVNNFHGFQDSGFVFRTCWSHGLNLLHSNMGLRPAPAEEVNLSEFVELCERLVPIFSSSHVDTAATFWAGRRAFCGKVTGNGRRRCKSVCEQLRQARPRVAHFVSGVLLLHLAGIAAYAYTRDSVATMVLDSVALACLAVYSFELLCRVACVGGLGTFLYYTPPFTMAVQACFNRIDLALLTCSWAGVGATCVWAAGAFPFGGVGAFPFGGVRAAGPLDATRVFLMLPTLRVLTTVPQLRVLLFNFLNVLSNHADAVSLLVLCVFSYAVVFCALLGGNVDEGSLATDHPAALNFNTMLGSFTTCWAMLLCMGWSPVLAAVRTYHTVGYRVPAAAAMTGLVVSFVFAIGTLFVYLVVGALTNGLLRVNYLRWKARPTEGEPTAERAAPENGTEAEEEGMLAAARMQQLVGDDTSESQFLSLQITPTEKTALITILKLRMDEIAHGVKVAGTLGKPGVVAGGHRKSVMLARHFASKSNQSDALRRVVRRITLRHHTSLMAPRATGMANVAAAAIAGSAYGHTSLSGQSAPLTTPDSVTASVQGEPTTSFVVDNKRARTPRSQTDELLNVAEEVEDSAFDPDEQREEGFKYNFPKSVRGQRQVGGREARPSPKKKEAPLLLTPTHKELKMKQAFKYDFPPISGEKSGGHAAVPPAAVSPAAASGGRTFTFDDYDSPTKSVADPESREEEGREVAARSPPAPRGGEKKPQQWPVRLEPLAASVTESPQSTPGRRPSVAGAYRIDCEPEM